jgi:hypothetical protein
MTDHDLPDLFRFDDGTRVRDGEDWTRRRQEIAEALIPIEYGKIPPGPAATTATLICSSTAERFESATFQQFRVTIAQDVSFGFRLDLLVPRGDGPFPAIIYGDGCWRYLTDEITREILARGNILAQFSRVEIVADCETRRPDGLHLVFSGDYGALTAWAWGYHRVVDILVALPEVNPTQIAIAGHSRGGKTTLLAGATDERIALVHANQSGCGGAGCFRWQAPGSETLGDILKNFPHWFAPGLKDFIGREETLPFDQHSLKAMVAPRPLLTTESLDDPWANPEGTWQSHRAAREVYGFLGAEENIEIQFRHGPHDHALVDWVALLDFMDVHFRGKTPVPVAEGNPFVDLPPAHLWHSPL